MKKIVFALCVSLMAGLSFSYTGADVNSKLGDFANEINVTLPNAATQQNVYSSAWIGKVFPSTPPHFALGIEAGVTKFNLKPLKDMAKIFGVSGLPDLMVYPTITANARVGGFFLPFDIGFSAMYLNLSKLDSFAEGLGIKFFNIGGDIRYAILKGEGAAPQLSLGFGYYYIGGSVSYGESGLKANLDYASHTMFGQVQLSKTFMFFTPYLGFRGIFSKSATDWSWSVSAAKVSPDYVDTTFGGSGKNSNSFGEKFMPQIYGGFGLNFGAFALNFGAAYEFVNKIWGGDFSIRFQM